MSELLPCWGEYKLGSRKTGWNFKSQREERGKGTVW